MKEIGSEFWTTEPNKNHELFFLSGRTALDFIIRDIMAEKTVGKVFLPALCCHSMIEPFLSNGISVSFYEIFFENGMLKANIPQPQCNDIFFYMEFFGYKNQNMGNIPEIKKNGCAVIKDATHSWLTDSNITETADYTFVSYRKWTGLTGIATAKKLNGTFTVKQKNIYHTKYEELRLTAQKKKNSYISTNTGIKQEFLNSFSEAEDLLDADYVDYLPTLESLSALWNLDKTRLAFARRQNAEILLNGLADTEHITPIFSHLDKNDIPLCVPILTDSDIRNSLRKHLIDRQIYCPVHWPLSDLHRDISQRTEKIYKSQLSLICDQRYGTEDMEHIIKCIKEFFNK